MKMFNVKMFALALVLGATGQSFGYWYGLSNNTGTSLMIKIQVEGGGYFFDLIEDNEREVYKFGGGDIARCLASIHATEFDANKKYRGPDPKFTGKNAQEIKDMARETDEGTDIIHKAGAFHDAFYAVAESHGIRYVKMFMEPKAVYEATSKAARSLIDGVEVLGCKGLELAMQSSPEAQLAGGGKNMLDNITDWFKGGSTTTDSAKLTTLLADLNKLVKTPTGLTKTVRVESAISLVGKHKDLLKGSFVTIDGHLRKGENRQAVRALNDFISSGKVEDKKGLLDEAKDWWNSDDKAGAAIKLGTDKLLGSDKSILESDDSLEKEWQELLKASDKSNDLETSVDLTTNKTSAAEKKEQCALGLAKIAKASSQLKGSTLCKDRDFELIYGGKGVRVINGKEYPQKYDDYIAITVIGE